MKIDMKKFFLRLSIFISIVIFILLVGMFLPATPRAKTSLLYAKIDKDSMLENTTGNRLILVGGSNLSFGINSQLLKDSLNVNPINTGIQASLGLEYMIKEVVPFIKKGDVIVLSPEYNNFYGTFAYGGEVLCRMFFDVQLKKGNKSFVDNFSELSKEQMSKIIMYYPKYVSSKFSPFEYLTIKKDPVYSRDSFNKYGDVTAHFNLPNENYLDLDPINEEFNYKMIDVVKSFEKQVSMKGAKLFITFPAIEKQSYENNKNQINNIFIKIKEKNLSILGTPSEFVVSKDLTFNGYCHLNKQGMEVRTEQLIKELHKVL